MRNTEILAATTSAADSSTFTVDQETVAIYAYNLSGDETAKLQVAYDGTNFMDVYIDGLLIELTALHNIATVYGPGIYRLSKSTTAGAASLHTAS